ncbi:hypothetical protein Tco_1084814 [Tanacetum coccineum]
MYLTASKPDLNYVVCLCARYQAKPTKKHLQAVKRIFRYLNGIINMGLWYSKDTDMSLIAYADADHAGSQDTRRSTSGSAQFLDCLIWVLITNLWIDLWLSFTFKIPSTASTRVDCFSAATIVQHFKSKTQSIFAALFIKRAGVNGIVELYFVRTEYQLADIFTKPLPRERFNFLIDKLGMESTSPEMLKRLAEETDE